MGLSKTVLRAVAMVFGLGLAAIVARPADAQGPPPPGCTGQASSVWINVTIEQVRNSSGQITLTLYPDDKSRYLKPGGALAVTKVPARAGVTQACIFVPGPGLYALVLYHDANSNGKIDRNLLGIPKEGFGFSNNPRILFSAPSLKSVQLQVNAPGLPTRIRMRYP
jgi:uncharacterized protein (DUF2141 family)